ncbi:MAG: AMP-binding protein [Burkholderiaceae bacterium]
MKDQARHGHAPASLGLTAVDYDKAIHPAPPDNPSRTARPLLRPHRHLMAKITIPAISDSASLDAIERQPLEHWLPTPHILALLEHAAEHHGGRPALIHLPDGEPGGVAQTVSFETLLSDVRRAANLFHALGVGPDDSVALMAPNMPDAQIAMWGAEIAAQVCPINVLLAADHVGALLRAARARVLVALGPDPRLPIWSQVQALRAGAGIEHVLVIGDEIPAAPGVRGLREALAGQDGSRLTFDRHLDRDSAAALFHTGGTTGLPKLARHRHGNQLHTAWSAAAFYALTERDVMLNPFPLFHVAGAFVYGASCIVAGAAQVLPPRTGMRDARFVEHFWRHVHDRRVTAIGGVPTTLSMMLNIEPGQDELENLRLILTGGSPLPSELALAVEQRFGRPVRNIFGMTESAGLVAIEPFLGTREAGSVGLRLPYSQVCAFARSNGDVDFSRPCPPGQTGVIALRGPHVGGGYTDASRNADTFADDGWLISGDLGHVDAHGRLFVTGRAKDVIIRGAHNIDPGQIEEAFAALPEVALAAAVGQPDAHAGEVPVVFVTLKPDHSATPEALAVAAAGAIAEAPARPRRVIIIGEMPLTGIGKIYKPALRRDACVHAFRQALAGLGEPPPDVVVQDDGGQLRVSVDLRGAADAARIEAVRAALRGFPVPWRLAD